MTDEDKDETGAQAGDPGHPIGGTFSPMGGELDLDADDRLPWLDTEDDDYDGTEIDTGRVVMFALAAFALLAVVVGGIWWVTHKPSDASAVADGGIIPAPSQPYKEAPRDPGGKTFAGTGDTSYAVSQGKDDTSHLAGGGTLASAAPPTAAAASPQAKPSAQTSTKPAAAHDGPRPAPVTAGGVAVQVGAYGSQAGAEAAWSKLVGKTEALKGVSHRVQEGNADIGKVYRLQAVVGDEAAGNALCSKLKSAGIACQVKR